MRATVILAGVSALQDELRDLQIAAALDRCGIDTHYVPQLADGKEQFDAELLGERFIELAQRLRLENGGVPVGLAGSSGAGAGALAAASMRPDLISAVVSIDGRTDLAVEHLRGVKTPALLVVKDMPVLRMNREAVTQLRGERRIEIIHEGGTEAVVEKTVNWFADKLAPVPADAYGMI